MRRTTGTKAVSHVARDAQPQVFYRINSLLQVMRVIEQHEVQLCTLMHDIKSSGEVSREVAAELRSIIEDMPSTEYQDDLDAVRRALSAVPAGVRKPASSHSASSKRVIRKKTAVKPLSKKARQG